MKRICNPFPSGWCRNVDFLPTMFLQSKLNKDQEVYFFKGHVSSGRSRPTEAITTDLGISIAPSVSHRDRVDISFGMKIPNIDDKVSNNEIWNTFKEEMPDQPDIVIEQRGSIHKVPENVMFKKPFDGADLIFQQQTAIGNRHRSIYQKTGIPVVSSYRIARDGLYTHGVIEAHDPCLKRIKSTLATDFLLPSNDIGYNNFQDILFDVERGLRGKIYGRARGIHWWEDTAIPRIVHGNYDNTAIDIRICELDDRRQQLIGI